MAAAPEILDAPVLAVRSFGIAGPALDMVITELVLQPLGIILVANRLWVRRSSKKSFGMDDYLIVASLVFCIAMNVVNIVAVDKGYGRPSHTLPPNSRRTVLKLFYVLQIFYKCTINLTKLSIILLYRKIFNTNKYKFRTICNVIGGSVVVYAISSVVANIFECTPVARQWDPFLPGSCISLTGFWYANAVFNILSDFIVLLLPLPIIYELNLPMRRKIPLMGIFGLGLFVCVTSIVRSTTLKVSSKAVDQSEGTVPAVMWSTIEAEMGIICSCLPMLRVPMARVCPFLWSSYHPSDHGPSIRSYRFSDIEVQERSQSTKRTSEGDETLPDRRSSSTIAPRRHVHVALLPEEVPAQQFVGVVSPDPDSSLPFDHREQNPDLKAAYGFSDNLALAIPGFSLYTSTPCTAPTRQDNARWQTYPGPCRSPRSRRKTRSPQNGIGRPPDIPLPPLPKTLPATPRSPDSPTIPDPVHIAGEPASSSPETQPENHTSAEVGTREVS